MNARAAYWGFAALVAAACGSSEATSTPDDGGSSDAGREGGDDGGGGGDDAGDGGGARGDSGCHTASDCSGTGVFCAAFTLPPLCGGVCDPIGAGPLCQDDSECADGGASAICEAQICNCPHGGAQPQQHCRKGCTTAADCGTGLTCNATHRCEAAPCNGPVSCGSKNFACNSGHCTPSSCTKDGDCKGYCVDGTCSATPGVCQAATP